MISVCIPSRGRPDSLAAAVHSLHALSDGDVEIVVGLDADDPCLPRYQKAGLRAVLSIAGRPDTLGAVTNRLAEKARGDICVVFGDDMAMATRAWDRVIEDSDFVSGPLAFQLNDPTHPGFPTYFACNREWIEAMGFLIAPWFPFWFSDTWVWEVGLMTGRLRRVGVDVRSIGGRGETTGLREVPWWAELFNDLRPMRIEQADRISSWDSQAIRDELMAIRPRVIEAVTAAKAHMLTYRSNDDGEPSARYLRAKAAADDFRKSIKERFDAAA